METHGGSWVQCTWSRNWKPFWLLSSKFQVKLFSLEYHIWCYDSPYPVYASANFVVLLAFHDLFCCMVAFYKKVRSYECCYCPWFMHCRSLRESGWQGFFTRKSISWWPRNFTVVWSVIICQRKQGGKRGKNLMSSSQEALYFYHNMSVLSSRCSLINY